MIEKFLVEIEDNIEQLERRRDAIKRVLHNQEEEFYILKEYRVLMEKEIKNLEEDISELRVELKTIQEREAK